MSVEHISEGLGSHQIQKAYLDAKQKAESTKKESQDSAATQSDRVEISEDAKRLAEKNALAQRAKESVESLPEPELRHAKIHQTMARKQTGYYERKEVLDKTASEILNKESHIESPGTAENERNESISEDAELRLEKIREVEKRIQESYYERKEVVESIIDRLLGQ